MWTSPSLILPSTPPISTSGRRRRPLRRRYRLITSSASDPLTAAGRLLWGRALPPQPLISAVRSAWSAAWLLMMRQLAPSSPSGSYSRPSSPFPSVPTRYLTHPSPHLHLYAALPCPWAHRTLIVRALRSLEPSLSVSIAAPGADGSWEFGGSGDPVTGGRTLREVYGMMRGGYDGRSTVPMLWDKDRREVVCNESYGIIEFLNCRGGEGPDLSPPELKEEIDKWNQIIYPNVNNGVYSAGNVTQAGDCIESANVDFKLVPSESNALQPEAQEISLRRELHGIGQKLISNWFSVSQIHLNLHRKYHSGGGLRRNGKS